jgi:protocatechuate 4,5-dioxygenase, alpha chain
VVTGNGLYMMGARMRGESYEQFLATRNDRGAT